MDVQAIATDFRCWTSLPAPSGAWQGALWAEDGMTLGARSAVLQRRLKIAEWIRQHGQMRVDELSAALAVSEVTIRSDLTYLEEQGLILRRFGKAVAAQAMPPRERAPASLLTKALTLPMLRLASALVEPDQTVLIGPAALPGQIIPLLAELPGLSVVLSTLEAVPLARACLDGRVHVLGGELAPGGGALRRRLRAAQSGSVSDRRCPARG